ncbi:oxidoreductase, partial [Bradyrhizobium elkanii]
MPITVKTFTNTHDAAAALSSDRSARYLGGGTLVMRALNEGDISISTVVRASDHAMTRIDATGSRITLGAGVTFARVLADRDLAFLHAPARSIGGPAVRNMGTVGGNLFAPVPYGDFTVAMLALDATVSVQGGLGGRDIPIEEFLQSRDRQAGSLVLAISFARPGSTEAFRYRKIARIKPKAARWSRSAAHLPVNRQPQR